MLIQYQPKRKRNNDGSLNYDENEGLANNFGSLFSLFVALWCDGSSDRSSMVDPLSYFSFQPVLHKAMVCAILSVG